ncbi:MAG: hypothetical protein J6U16_06365, partial [Ruminococcus sp.]|nr:hypothetical protein [Ruminococcus sp.]
FGFAEPIVKVIDAKPYDIKISGIYSVSGEKVLDETADSAKIAEIKSGIIVSLEMAVKSVDFTPENYSVAAASAMIKEKALSWYNDNYAALTGYKLTNLSINSIDIKEQAASTVTTATAAETTTTTAATTTTASVSTAVSTSSLKPKFIYAITFCDADTGSYIKGVQFTLKTNNDEDEDYGTVTAESAYTTLRGYGNKFTLTIVGVPEGYKMPKPDTFATETISDLVMTICISKDGTAYVKPRESSSTTASASAGSTTTTTTTATAAASTTASASGTMKVSTTATAASTTAPASTTAAATTVTEVVTTEMSEKDFVGTWRATGLLDSVGEREEAPFDAPFILSLNEDGTCVLSYDSDERHDTIELNWEYKDKTFNLLNDAGKPLPLKYENDELVLELNGNTLFLSKEDSYLGYVNDDDKIDAKDASVVLVAYAKASTGASYGLTEKKCAAADVNHDGKVDAKDASAILSYYSYISTGGKESIAAFLKASN